MNISNGAAATCVLPRLHFYIKYFKQETTLIIANPVDMEFFGGSHREQPHIRKYLTGIVLAGNQVINIQLFKVPEGQIQIDLIRGKELKGGILMDQRGIHMTEPVVNIPVLPLGIQYCPFFRTGEYQSDERAGVARLSWRVSGK